MKIEKPDWLLRTEGILETLNEGVIIADDCDRYIYANSRVLEMMGLPLEELLGKGAEHFFQGEELAFVRREREKGLLQGHNRSELFLPQKNGNRLPVVASARVIEDLEGREYTLMTLTDISEQKIAEEKLRVAYAQLEARQQEIDRDLALAARVQQSLAPRSLEWGPFRVEALYQPVSTIGGDFGVVAPVGSQLHLLVCDVSGHGISSALIANRIYTEMMTLLGRGAAAKEMMQRLNSFVLNEIQMPGFYFTMAMAQLDSDRRRMFFHNAGHPPAIWARPSGETKLLEARSAVLGLLEDAVDGQPGEDLELHAGDRVMLYTDGISEVFNQQEELLGHTGLQEIVSRAARKPFAEMKEQVLGEIAAWRYGPVTDDISMVLIEVA